MKHLHKYNSNLTFIDMLFIMVLGFVFLLVLAVRLMNPPVKKNEVESRAEFIITMSWHDDSPHDIDLWCLTPDLEKIGFMHREGAYVHLERDDLGHANDRYFEPGSTEMKIIAINREVITLRARKPGRYVVNAYFFARKQNLLNNTPVDMEPVAVQVELVQVHPKYKVITKREIVLANTKEEKTAFSFTIGGNGELETVETTEQLFLLDTFAGGGAFEMGPMIPSIPPLQEPPR